MKEGRSGRVFREGEVVRLGACVDGPPKPPPNPWKGHTKYPFDELEVGHAIDVLRSREAVKDAVRRYRKRNPSKRFQVWKRPEGWVRVKRVK